MCGLQKLYSVIIVMTTNRDQENPIIRNCDENFTVRSLVE
jgi:hypothetical protein